MWGRNAKWCCMAQTDKWMNLHKNEANISFCCPLPYGKKFFSCFSSHPTPPNIKKLSQKALSLIHNTMAKKSSRIPLLNAIKRSSDDKTNFFSYPQSPPVCFSLTHEALVPFILIQYAASAKTKANITGSGTRSVIFTWYNIKFKMINFIW